MRREAKQLCDLLERHKAAIPGARFTANESECSLTVSKSQLTVEEIQNTDPPTVNLNIGTAIEKQQIADPEELPEASSQKYRFVGGLWQNLRTDEEYSPEELIEAAVEILEEYVSDERST